MNVSDANHTIFFTVVRTLYGKTCARLLIESLRTFGGVMQNCPFWLFEAAPEKTPCQDLEYLGVKILQLEPPEQLHNYLFRDKVFACAQAESLAPIDARSLVWIDPVCLIVQPPLLYALDEDHDAAFRSVHIRNVGSLTNQPMDAFWQKIYDVVGVKDTLMTVESFIDAQRLRAYFNSHAFAVNPAKGLMKRWLAHFGTLVSDQTFQSDVCQDDDHQVFLFQAVLSTIIASSVEAPRLRLLPSVYNYPYNLQEFIPSERRAKAFNDLVSFTYEDQSLNLQKLNNIDIHEPLLGWFMERENILPEGV